MLWHHPQQPQQSVDGAALYCTHQYSWIAHQHQHTANVFRSEGVPFKSDNWSAVALKLLWLYRRTWLFTMSRWGQLACCDLQTATHNTYYGNTKYNNRARRSRKQLVGRIAPTVVSTMVAYSFQSGVTTVTTITVVTVKRNSIVLAQLTNEKEMRAMTSVTSVTSVTSLQEPHWLHLLGGGISCRENGCRSIKTTVARHNLASIASIVQATVEFSALR